MNIHGKSYNYASVAFVQYQAFVISWEWLNLSDECCQMDEIFYTFKNVGLTMYADVILQMTKVSPSFGGTTVWFFF